MNILVCVKQVPDTTEMKIDPETNTLIREGVESILNTYDGYALEKALSLKDSDPSIKVTVLSMGPNQAEPMLRDCIAVGADEAYLATDRMFGGSDTLATSYILSVVIKALEEKKGEKFDLIFCGKQAIDGDTAQVGPELAEHLDLSQITYGIACELKDGKIVVTRELDEDNEVVESTLPCLVTFTKTDDLRYATIKNKMKSKKAEIKHITHDDVCDLIDDSKIGLKGSPTRVRKTYTPERNKDGLIIKEEDADLAVSKLMDALTADKIL